MKLLMQFNLLVVFSSTHNALHKAFAHRKTADVPKEHDLFDLSTGFWHVIKAYEICKTDSDIGPKRMCVLHTVHNEKAYWHAVKSSNKINLN